MPYEHWYSVFLDLSHLHEIGSHAFVLIQGQHNPKVLDQSVELFSSDTHPIQRHPNVTIHPRAKFLHHSISYLSSLSSPQCPTPLLCALLSLRLPPPPTLSSTSPLTTLSSMTTSTPPPLHPPSTPPPLHSITCPTSPVLQRSEL
jgi:hypothetical protein